LKFTIDFLKNRAWGSKRMDYKAQLLERIQNRTAKVGVIGLGYVGLPLAVEFARNGFHVIGFDVAQGKVDLCNRGESYIGDVKAEELADVVKAGRFRATVDFSALAECDTVSICVPTPLRKTRDPDVSYIIKATEQVKKYLRPGTLVVLESTTYPGTTDELMLPELSEGGLVVGKDYFLAFSPERVDPGNPRFNTKNTPKVVGGTTDACSDVVKALYETTIEKVIPVSSTRAAEMVKILENTFRAINIGLANELAIMCDKLNIDVWEVIEAASTKPFGFMPFYPGPGLGGHCIPIDPHYLSWKLKSVNYNARFIELASEINTQMPNYVVTKVADALNSVQRSVKGSRILVLGAAYKKDISDVRESPALDVIKLLQAKGARVEYNDPYIPDLHEEGIDLASVPIEGRLSTYDCIVIATDHKVYDYARISAESKLIVDTRNATRGYGALNVVRL
jgi:UDP-N-acetyl-D-glucosamine dehydrogenase